MKTEVCLAFIVILAFASRANGDKDQNDLENRKIDSQIMTLLLRRSFCCWGPCIENPQRACCNTCMTERQYNFGKQGEGQNGYNNKQNYGVNTKYNYGEQGQNQGGNGNTQNYRKREWMSDTNQLD